MEGVVVKLLCSTLSVHLHRTPKLAIYGRDTFTWHRGRRLPPLTVQLREQSSQALERACSPHGLSVLPHPPGLSHRPECGLRRPNHRNVEHNTSLPEDLSPERAGQHTFL